MVALIVVVVLLAEVVDVLLDFVRELIVVADVEMLVMVMVLSVVADVDDEVSVTVLIDVAELVVCVTLMVELVDVLLELVAVVVPVVSVAVVDEVRLDEVAVPVDDAVVVLQAHGQYSATPGFPH